ncbi:skin secretory protein xP2-like [Mastacembelus armatus]|uniref:skin secretory protein xP2-like n=1 Tax=Mastacembelus armatus TaxID=205130 RepID=UPI000E45DE95|nr:skin secretory protein xP2-like [Mastacembelus armatus]
MGCSSSSAQTVDQEKKPGTKPEEDNRDTVAVINGIVTEDAQAIEGQIQLPVQIDSQGHLQPGTDDEAEAVSVALEAQEDLGSGEDLLATPEPQPGPAVFDEPAPEAPDAAPAEASTGTEAAVDGVETQPPLEEAAPVETVVTEVRAVAEATEEAPDVECVVAGQAEGPAVVEEVTAEDPVEYEPAEAAVAVEEALTVTAETPKEAWSPVEAEGPTDNVAPETSSETPTETSVPAPSEALALDKASAPSESSVPVEAEDLVIDTEIAVATIPEMPPLPPVIFEAQAEPQPSTEEAMEPPVPPVASPAEAPCSTVATPALTPEATSADAELVQVAETLASTPPISESPTELAPEASPVTMTSGSMVDDGAPEEAPVVEPIPADSEAPSAPSAPGPAADPAFEPLPEVATATDASQTKKED